MAIDNKADGISNMLSRVTPNVPFAETLAVRKIKSFDTDGDGELSVKEAQQAKGFIRDKVATTSVTNKADIIATLDKFETKDSNIFRDDATGKMPLVGLKISPEAAQALSEATRGAADPAQKSNSELISRKEKEAVIRSAQGLDRDGKDGVTKEEAKESAESLKAVASQMPVLAKKKLLEEYEVLQQSDPNGEKEAKRYKEMTGIEMDPKAALIIREAKAEGAKSPNPDPAIAAKEEEEKKEAAKAGKGTGEKKDFLTMIIDFIMTALGLNKEEEKQKETAVAAKQNPTPDEKKKDEKGTGEPQKALENLDPAVLAAVFREGQIQQEKGLKIMKDSILEYQAGANKPQPKENSVRI